MIGVLIEMIRDMLGLNGGTSVWQVLWEIPDAEVVLLPPGRHRTGIPIREVLGQASQAIAHHVAGGGRHRLVTA